MGTINAVRLINISYNNGGIRINDEILNFNGEDTLISLQNGGGKSVLVQMLTAPFVHKAYRKTKDRPFEGYFTGLKPSFILTEWNLDHNAGKVMNGLMIRRRPQDTDDGDGRDELEMIGIISEYHEACSYDIRNLPVVEKTKKEMRQKSFSECRQIFEELKRDRHAVFYCYDMGQQAYQRQYFDKLAEYKIDYREWENIIKKVNMKEGGLADLFSDCRDEKSLTEKWFLDAVEKKLDPDGGRMKEFARIIEMHSRQCYENQDKIKRKDNINRFRDLVAPETDVSGEGVRSRAERLSETDAGINAQIDRLISFLGELKKLTAGAEDRMQAKQDEIDESVRRAEEIRYEKISAEIYDVTAMMKEAEKNRQMTAIEIDSLERELENGEKQLALLRCRRLADEFTEEHRRCEELRMQLETARKKDDDLKPRRAEVGSILYEHYSSECSNLTKRIGESEAEAEDNENRLKNAGEGIKKADTEMGEARREEGALQAEIAGYDRDENDYNKLYGDVLRRNILGRYEEGALQIESNRLEAELRKTGDDLRAERNELSGRKTMAVRLASDINDLKLRRNEALHDKQQAENRLAELEDQKQKRRDIMQYLGIPDRRLYDTDHMITMCDTRIEEVDADIRLKQDEVSKKNREISALQDGRIVELPENVIEGFDRLGINVFFGMEWLRKNRRSMKDNLRLVRKNPFLPYAVVLSREDLNRLEQEGDEIFTAWPLPVLLREDLDRGIVSDENRRDRVIDLEGIRFYVRFNENYLDEEKLRGMIAEKRDEISRITEKLRIRTEEKDSYYEKRELIRSQTLSEEIYDEAVREIARLTDSLKVMEREADEKTSAERENSEAISALNAGINRDEELQRALTERIARTEALCGRYERYLDNMDSLQKVREKITRLENRKALLQSEMERYQGLIAALRDGVRMLRGSLEQLEEKRRHVEIYAADAGPAGSKEGVECDIEALEAEYRAITEQFSGEVRFLEKGLDDQKRRAEKAERELEEFAADSSIASSDYETVIYSRENEDRQRAVNSDLTARKKDKERQYHKEDKQVSVLRTKIEGIVQQMKRETGKDIPAPAESIVRRNFDEELNVLEDALKTKRTELGILSLRRQEYMSLQAGLAEYEGQTACKSVVWEDDFLSMDRQQLAVFEGRLQKELKKLQSERQRQRNALADRLNDLLVRGEFQDDYYRKPLEAMVRSVDQPDEVVIQIDTTIAAYDELMKKIAVDLSMIEEERASIEQEIFDHLRNAHAELDKIDSNSTIPVRDRPVKMLMIKLPTWEENEEIYRLRLRDHVGAVVSNCMERHGRNESLTEFTCMQMNLRALYDSVVGVGSVQIKLFKIEKEREYPISWTEVSRNSGGEGFLSAFVILSSLLHYMRRDDNDLFADKNEGKVLLMDNPFGVTYSEHLLKPMMELARKNNTQLICLSGIGGDSIYGRFDNIYVLNLVEAGLKNGMQYLQPDHVRGSDPREIIPSQIEVVEQLRLF